MYHYLAEFLTDDAVLLEFSKLGCEGEFEENNYHNAFRLDFKGSSGGFLILHRKISKQN